MQGHQPLSASQGGWSHSCWEARPTSRPRAAPAALELCGPRLEPRAVEFPSAPPSTPFHPAQPHTHFSHEGAKAQAAEVD